ncbi:MAG: aldo/keto reductase [Anaerolineae bacterium]|jgi:aryl-alcohol dehydrogenase-like predicted oxidoreductase|nr:aldo/keto reductase [Chloroflexota bacterium]
MQYRTLTGTGVTISRASLGTMTFGNETDEATAIRMLHMALDAGVTWIDTADAYTAGRSEEITGKALQGHRDDVVLASKVVNYAGGNPQRDTGLHRWHVINGVERSLRRLNTDRLDILYMHRPDYQTPIEETLAAFDTLVQQGKVVYVGMSNYASWQLCETLFKARINRWAPPVVTQVPYNLLTRRIEQELLPFVREHRLGVTVYNPLAGGYLTGKYHAEARPTAGARLGESEAYFDRYWKDANFRAVARLQEIANQAGLTLIELSLRWLLAQDAVDSIILGARTPGHLSNNLAALDGALDADTLKACDEAWDMVRGVDFQYNR